MKDLEGKLGEARLLICTNVLSGVSGLLHGAEDYRKYGEGEQRILLLTAAVAAAKDAERNALAKQQEKLAVRCCFVCGSRRASYVLTQFRTQSFEGARHAEEVANTLLKEASRIAQLLEQQRKAKTEVREPCADGSSSNN